MKQQKGILAIFDVAKNMRQLAESIDSYAKLLQAEYCETESADCTELTSSEALTQETEIVQVTIEQVRAVLAAKSKDGKQAEVKALIGKFGANKLTDIEPKHYAELLKSAGEL